MKLRTKILLSVGVILFLSLGLSTMIHIRDLKQNFVAKPISALITIGEHVASGHLGQISKDAHIRFRQNRHDEVGRLTNAFQKMMVYLQDMAQAATRISKGDLRQKVIPRSEHDVLGIAFQQILNRG